MSPRLGAVTLAGLLLITSISGQPQSETAALEGLVVRAGSDDPVAGAQVILVRDNTNIEPWAATARVTPTTGISRGLPSEVPDVTTDANGRFSLKNVVPGSYLIAVVAQGYVRQQFGQKPPGLRGKAIQVGSRETRKDLKISLTQTGVVAGRVLDSAGQPKANILVELLRLTYDSDGTRLLQSYLAAGSNDRGEYRLFGAGPGRYYLFAGGSLNPDGNPYSQATYPHGGADVSRALPIDVVAGAETTAPPWIMPSTNTYTVRGRLIDGQTARPPESRVLLQLFNVEDTEIRSTSGWTSVPSEAYKAIDGSFTIDSVPSGEYLLDISVPNTRITGPVEEIQRRAQLAPRVRNVLHVKDHNVENLVLTLEGGQSVEGRIQLDGQTVSAIPNVDGIRPQLRPSYAGRYLAGQRSPLIEPGESVGAFRIVGLIPGEYLVSVVGIPSGFFLKELRYRGESVLGIPLQFSSASPSGLEIVLKQGAAEVRGTVTNLLGDAIEGVTAVLVPADRGRTDLYKTATTDRTGRFAIPEVAPGDYKLFSWEGLAPNAYLNSDVVAAVETQGRAVRVAPSSSADVSVTMIPAK